MGTRTCCGTIFMALVALAVSAADRASAEPSDGPTAKTAAADVASLVADLKKAGVTLKADARGEIISVDFAQAPPRPFAWSRLAKFSRLARNQTFPPADLRCRPGRISETVEAKIARIGRHAHYGCRIGERRKNDGARRVAPGQHAHRRCGPPASATPAPIEEAPSIGQPDHRMPDSQVWPPSPAWKTLDLSKTGVGDAALTSLQALPKLARLNLYHDPSDRCRPRSTASHDRFEVA